jgi:hypothetical protein
MVDLDFERIENIKARYRYWVVETYENMKGGRKKGNERRNTVESPVGTYPLRSMQSKEI